MSATSWVTKIPLSSGGCSSEWQDSPRLHIGGSSPRLSRSDLVCPRGTDEAHPQCKAPRPETSVAIPAILARIDDLARSCLLSGPRLAWRACRKRVFEHSIGDFPLAHDDHGCP